MSSAAQWTRQNKVKSAVWAVGFAAVIMVGSLTGAQLKQDKQKEEAIKQFRETTAAEQIAILEDQKLLLLEQKAALQRKLDAFDERVREREMEKQRRARRST
ncbi:unnamed protein product [Clonostachys byssicola]|uniref:Uncharacterized protein n=1 Tax=Clonostachys byssicola TaxID=160290 RepID=A0A9N9UCX0_9HYPO|nr:unnamed protein product [Clonostachys byssicola]